MKSAATVMLGGLALATAIAAAQELAAYGELPPQEKPGAAKTQAHSAGARGEVVEAINAGDYTYVHVDTGEEKVWAAAPHFAVEVGDRVAIPAGHPMPDYYSKTLKRRFDLVYFVTSVSVEGGGDGSRPTRAEERSPRLRTQQRAAVDLSGISKAAGGMTVGEIFDQRGELEGHEILVRGKVVKFTGRIMGKNWVHIQDGTAGGAGAFDLTVTTNAVAAVGDTILVRGVLSINRDFGYGYRYDAIIEDASVTLE